MPDFRIIPSIEQLRQRPRMLALEGEYGHTATTAALRDATAALRRAIGSGAAEASSTSAEAIAEQIESHATQQLADRFRGSLRPIINATGVILHTNLGRAPLATAALHRLLRVAGGYSNLEYDLALGSRGSRTVHVETLLTSLTGAEAAVVVNNNAAATMLMLAALAAGREVVVSRGELVEIGGGFRVPDVMLQSGAVLREVGTTNRTRVADYRAAIGPKTALVLRVHPSNFRIDGFTERPALEELVAAARDSGVPVVEDLGSGCLLDSLTWEPSVQASLAANVDLVCFSGDKLLGGPQAGIVLGRKDLMQRLRQHPLMRALRVDKLTLAALEGTLIEYLAGRARETVPVLRMIHLDPTSIEARARVVGERVTAAGWAAALESGSSTIGGGSAPGVELPTVLLAVSLKGWSPEALDRKLRSLDPAVVARITENRVVLDLRTVAESDDTLLGELLERVTRAPQHD